MGIFAEVACMSSDAVRDRHLRPVEPSERVVDVFRFSVQCVSVFTGEHVGRVENYVAIGKRGAQYGCMVYSDGSFRWFNARNAFGSVPFDLAQVSPRAAFNS